MEDTEARQANVEVETPVSQTTDSTSVPVVGIGASAGGLEAMKEFMAATPNDVGACFVFVQHLDPGHKSMLTELLGRCTDMPVRHAEDGTAIAANQLIVIPPDATLTIHDGVLRLQRPAPPRTHRTPIDTFFHSLAADQGERAIAIILSGTGSDGTQGLKAVKEAGGFTIIQEPATAKYDSMPRNAEATGLVDQALPAGDMPACLVEYLEHIRQEARQEGGEKPPRNVREQLAKICGHLKLATGHDFRHYKEPTLLRRVQRRMQVLRLAEVDEYVRRLREDNKEARQLFRELLVSVTGFFRDPTAFDALDQRVLADLLDNRESDEPVRVWVAGCATGEEAYSIAMALHDRVAQHSAQVRLQIFATDIDDAALEVARRGTYPDSIAAYVPERFLKQYFRVVGSEYQVREEIRELCIFSTQSLVKDPPFSRLDLISCRNVLIYFRPELQDRLIPVFHYALRPGGYLFLGTSENVTRQGKLFDTVDKKTRIFRRRDSGERPALQFPLMELIAGAQQREAAPERSRAGADGTISLAERLILDEFGPAYAIVGENREMVYSGGRIEPFLRLQKGAPSLEILSIAHQSLRMDIRALLHRAAHEQKEVSRENITMELPTGRHRVSLLCRPLGRDQGAARRYLLIFRDPVPAQIESPRQPSGSDDADHLKALENELRATKEYLQTTTEELESSNEELKSANEELMSMNEELQSSNEELETSKEELQSVNEELETVNAELASKVDELGRTNADLRNLLESTQIATLFIDRSLRVRRFTPVAKNIFRLIDGDVGRSIGDITPRVETVDLAEEARAVLENLTPVEREVHLPDGGGTYMMRLLPYRTPDEVIDGVVATFVDVSRLKKARSEIDALNSQLSGKVTELEALLDLAPIGIAFADDPECSRIEVNRYGARIMKIPQKTPPAGDPRAGYRFIRQGIEVAAEDLPLQQVWRTGKPLSDFRATFVPADGIPFEFLMSATPVLDEDGRVRRVIGVYDDVTKLVEAQAAAERRAAQQDFVATTGNLSLRGHGAEALTDSLPEQLARILHADFVKVLFFQAQSGDFRLASRFGFDHPVGTIVAGGLDSQAGYTMHAATPVIVENLADEKRFAGPALLHDAGVVSGVSVIIGDPDEPWGVLGVHTRRVRAFTTDDVRFLQSVANVLAATLQRDEWERRQRLLLDELRHRVKNSLATVQAIASLSFHRATPSPEVVQTFIARLHALARAQNLHFESDGREIEFRDLIRQQVEPYDASGERIHLEGPMGIKLPPAVAIDMSMVVHELVTNAAKHGAMRVEGGTVKARWRSKQSDGSHVVVFDWQEKGGPPVEPPRVAGVGTKLMQAISNRSHCKLERAFEAEGLRYRFELVLDRH